METGNTSNLNIKDFNMKYAGVFFGRLEDLEAFQKEIREISTSMCVKIIFQEISRGKLHIKRED